MENMASRGELNSDNSDEEVDLVKDKLFTYLLVN